MGEKSFLKILKEYFSGKDEDEILIGNKDGIKIPIEWVFTEKVDRTIIERALVDVLIESNRNYVRNTLGNSMRDYYRNPENDTKVPIEEKREELRNKILNRVRGITLKTYRGNFEFSIDGLDEWTKAVISESPYKEGKMLQLSEDEFFDRILKVLKSDKINSILEKTNLTDEEKQNIQTIFLEEQNDSLDNLTVDNIKNAMIRAAENLIGYYDYLSEEKKESNIRNITIKQRQDSRGKRGKPKEEFTSERKSPVYPFHERQKVLMDMQPESVINVTEIDEDNNVIPGFYTTFIYRDPRDKEGYLLIAEPLEGSHSTRAVYISDERMEAFKCSEGKDKLEEVCKYYLEMSNEEFSREKNALKLNHKEIDNFIDKLRLIVRGEEKNKGIGYKNYYRKILNKLYGQKNFGASDIAHMGADAPQSVVDSVSGDFTKTHTIDKSKKAKGE